MTLSACLYGDTPAAPYICARSRGGRGAGRRTQPQASVASGLVATSVPSVRLVIWKSPNTAGATPAS